MNGRQLAEAALASRPGLRVLFICNAENAVLNADHLGAGVQVLTKRFEMEVGYSTVAPLAFTTRSYFANSAFTNAPNCVGVAAAFSTISIATRAFRSGDPSASANAR